MIQNYTKSYHGKSTLSQTHLIGFGIFFFETKSNFLEMFSCLNLNWLKTSFFYFDKKNNSCHLLTFLLSVKFCLATDCLKGFGWNSSSFSTVSLGMAVMGRITPGFVWTEGWRSFTTENNIIHASFLNCIPDAWLNGNWISTCLGSISLLSTPVDGCRLHKDAWIKNVEQIHSTWCLTNTEVLLVLCKDTQKYERTVTHFWKCM